MQLPGKVQSTWLSPLKYFLQTTPLPHILIYPMSFRFEESEELSLKAISIIAIEICAVQSSATH